MEWSSLKVFSQAHCQALQNTWLRPCLGQPKMYTLQDGKTSGHTDSTQQPRAFQPAPRESTDGGDRGAGMGPTQSMSDKSEGVGPGLQHREARACELNEPPQLFLMGP